MRKVRAKVNMAEKKQEAGHQQAPSFWVPPVNSNSDFQAAVPADNGTAAVKQLEQAIQQAIDALTGARQLLCSDAVYSRLVLTRAGELSGPVAGENGTTPWPHGFVPELQ